MNRWRGWLWWVWAFILCTRHRWRETREQWNNTKQIFLEQKTKKSFALRHLCPEYTRFWVEFGIHWYLDKLSIHLDRESVHLTVSLGISKTIPLATMSQQAHARWELRNWSPSTWLVRGHFKQIHSCMGICFSCMYTNNCEHFHK